ncbi:MAG: hypothetical protein AWT59_1968 [Candidatus Gallionella acididurans]|uniref:Uncharacterized protein n=1 Tax=Candidatus Gallionella acididurans TaxID=1796491 RepID=A0A139BSG4_9PROT|nr:MAG: hypothetical protein AWT59_1968 [Candidatus Gallionella acididurans]
MLRALIEQEFAADSLWLFRLLPGHLLEAFQDFIENGR